MSLPRSYGSHRPDWTKSGPKLGYRCRICGRRGFAVKGAARPSMRDCPSIFGEIAIACAPDVVTPPPPLTLVQQLIFVSELVRDPRR